MNPLVDQARALADEATPGSLQRRAAGCLTVLFATARTTAAARRNLGEIPLDDVRQAAAELLNQLEEQGLTMTTAKNRQETAAICADAPNGVAS